MSTSCYLPAVLCFTLIFQWPSSMVVESKPNPSEMAMSLFRSLTVNTCKVDCSSVKVRPVCGTDGVTYESKCEVRKAKKCDGKKIKIQKKGACDVNSKCLNEKIEALAAAKNNKKDVFVPACNTDGTFAPVQCHSQTGFCWCFTKEGDHVPGTSILGNKPRCNGKKNTKKQNKKTRCNRDDRQTFNGGLMKVFTDEYKRWNTTRNGESLQTQIMQWKFSQLDRNNDGILKFSEVRPFARMVRSFIKPKKCAKQFVKYCDSNKNKKIDISEWELCLGLGKKEGEILGSVMDHGKAEVEALRQAWQSPKSSQAQTVPQLSDAVLAAKGLSSIMYPESVDISSKPCMVEQRASRANHQRDPQANSYIPRCSQDGNWVQVQCHGPTEYCWCVNMENGSPIPGTSAFKTQPTCDTILQNNDKEKSKRSGENPLSKYLRD